MSDTLDIQANLVAWYCMNSDNRTHVCGKKVPNAFGLYDVIGNVAELVWDNYSGNYYANSPRFDPSGPSNTTLSSLRIARGGDFNEGVKDCRTASRNMVIDPRLRAYTTGIRLVRTR